MQLYTYGQLKTKLKNDMDLNDETFISEDEYVGLFNEAIDAAESEILGTFEDYFLTEQTLSLVSGTSEYSLPADIYATKIRGVMYRNGTNVYEIYPIRRLKKFLTIELRRAYSTTEDYKYFIKNTSSASGYKMVFLPVPNETSSNVTIFYIRNANKIPLPADGSQSATDATVIDIPEFYTFILKFVKSKILFKEKDSTFDISKAELQEERDAMVSTLEKMVVDDNDTVDMDVSFYGEHS